MATAAAPSSFTGLKSKDNVTGFTKSMDFIKLSDMQRVRFRRTKVSVIRNSKSEIVELQPASDGSPLLGIINVF